MPPKRRLPSSDAANPPPPRKSARLVTKAPSDDDSSGPSKTLTPRSNDNDSPGPSKKSQKDTSQGKTLSDPALVQEVRKMAENKAKAEIMILELMRKYSFDLSELQKLLNQNNVNVSFSNVRYVDIAPFVGLDPYVKGTDMPTFEMSYARLPNAIFSRIINDLYELELQYGSIKDHANEEARSRYLAGYFNKTVTLFSGLVFNTPETILEGRLTTKGRIEYQFLTYGGVTVVFIEVKLEIGGSTERLNCIAQVIAECDTCAWLNQQRGYDVPIMAILCDGKSFSFYKFVNKRHAEWSPQILMGKFPDDLWDIGIDNTWGSIGLDAFYQRLRRACDAFYYVFLSGYRAGLEGYWKRSVEKGKAQGKARDSTPGWQKAMVHATEALEEAISAWNQYNEGKLDESQASAEKAAQLLAESVGASPYMKESFLHPSKRGEEVLDL